MGIIIWLVMGRLLGWVASVITGTDAQQGIVLNVVVGVVGALLGGWLIGPLIGAGSINEGISLVSVLVSLAGAVVLIALSKLLRRGTSS